MLARARHAVIVAGSGVDRANASAALLEIVELLDCPVITTMAGRAAAPIDHLSLGEGELVVLYREEDMPDAPSRIDLKALEGKRFISLASSGPIGQLFTLELERHSVELDEVISARTFYIASALVAQGVGVTVVDSFTAQASLRPGLAMRPLKPPLAFGVHAMYLHNRPLTALATDFLKVLRSVIDVP